MSRPLRLLPLLAAPAVIVALLAGGGGAVSLAGLSAASSGRSGEPDDQLRALRASVDWITQYRPRNWVAVNAPGPCVTQPGGSRRCPIAIVIKASTGRALVDFRCAAEAVLRPRGKEGEPSRTSARCTRVPTAAPAASLEGSLVYSKELPSGFQLFTSRADGTGERQITHLPGTAEQPDWSPDGRTIVFQYNKPHERGCSIAFVDADGSNFRTLGGGPRICDNQPAYRHDGKRIVFVHYDDRKNTETLTVSKLDGSDRRELPTRLALGSADPNYSPDGKLITFVHLKAEEKLQALYAIRANGTGFRRLTPYRWEVATKHDWSPDGRRIAITRQRHATGKPPIALLLRRDGTIVRTLARRAYVGGYAPDGRHIVLRSERNDGAEARIAVVRPSGRGYHALTPWTELRQRFIDWGPR